jgi:hypothetical protein
MQPARIGPHLRLAAPGYSVNNLIRLKHLLQDESLSSTHLIGLKVLMRPAGISPHHFLQLLNHLCKGAPPALPDQPLLLNDLGTNRLRNKENAFRSSFSSRDQRW